MNQKDSRTNLGSSDASLSQSTSNCHLSTSSIVSNDDITNTIFCIVFDMSQAIKDKFLCFNFGVQLLYINSTSKTDATKWEMKCFKDLRYIFY